MGDATIDRTPNNPVLEVKMISREYLEYLDGVFGSLSRGVKLYRTAEEGAEMNRESGFSENANAENYSDIYRWRTTAHPELQEFAYWYSSGKKTFPDDIELTPTVFKHWYVCDGTVLNGNCVQLAISNEADDKDKINKMFEQSNLPSPTSYNETERDEYESVNCNARFSKEPSKKLYDYMGSPLPDFRYKFPYNEVC